METRFGVRGTVTEGIYFTESTIAGAQLVRHVTVEISRQNSDLSEVKQRLARQVAEAGASVLMNFRYGQKKHEWWELLKWDTESWHGEGDAVRI